MTFQFAGFSSHKARGIKGISSKFSCMLIMKIRMPPLFPPLLKRKGNERKWFWIKSQRAVEKKKNNRVHSTLALRSLIIQHAASLWKKETDKSHMLIVGPLWLTFGSNIPYCD